MGRDTRMDLIGTGCVGLPPCLGAGLVVTAASTVYLGIVNGFAFNRALTIMGAASGVLGGCLFWLARRPDRDGAPAPQANAQNA